MHSLFGVVGGSGGVGASTFCAALAAHAGGVLVDLDAEGGGVDVLLGVEDVTGARWSAVQVAGGHIDPAQLRDGLPRWDAVPVLVADRAPDARAVGAVLDAARLLGPVAVDLGRSPTAARRIAVEACALIVVLVAADLPGVAAARTVTSALDAAQVALVVRRGCIDPDEAGELVGAPVVGVLPAVRRRSTSPLHARRLPGALAAVAAGVADSMP